jgi:hypothetical protein
MSLRIPNTFAGAHELPSLADRPRMPIVPGSLKANALLTLDAAQHALAALMQRVHAGAGWTLSAAESRALDDGLWVYGVQLDHCSASEHRRAVRTVHNRIYQAARGNAGGRVVVHADPPA